MQTFVDILRVTAIVVALIAVFAGITFHQIAMREQNERKDGDTE